MISCSQLFLLVELSFIFGVVFQIHVIKDLPVGYNLQDHIGIGGLVYTIKPKVSLVQNRYENLPAVLRYAMFGAGKSPTYDIITEL